MTRHAEATSKKATSRKAAYSPGDRVAKKYRVESVLGQGGMGLVLAARHEALDERVALKLLRPDVAVSAEDVARFVREGRATSKLKSEHVVRVLDVGEIEPGSPYLAMELLEGEDVAKYLHVRGKLSVSDAVDIVLPACEAIAEAHTLGIIHRDLKPSNLFLQRRADGRICLKVLDFGISKFIAGPEVHLTSTQMVFGTPLYMAPEVLRSARNSSARSDMWALGCILFELLTGRPPFWGESVLEICTAVASGEAVRVSTVRSDVPSTLDAAIARCLEKEPANRMGSAFELIRAIASFGSQPALEVESRAARVVDAALARLTVADSSGAFSGVVPSETSLGTLRGWDTTGQAKPTNNAKRSKVTSGKVWLVASVVALTGAALGILGVKALVAPGMTQSREQAEDPDEPAVKATSRSKNAGKPAAEKSKVAPPKGEISARPEPSSATESSDRLVPSASTPPKASGPLPVPKKKPNPLFDDPN